MQQKKFSKHIVLIACLGFIQFAVAQPPATVHRLSAQEAVNMALEQHLSIANAKLDIESQRAQNAEYTGAAYPQVNAGFGVMKNFSIPVTLLPDFISPSVYGVLQKEGVKDGNGNPIVFDGVINTFPARFGVPWQASLRWEVQQLLFQPDVFVALKARKNALTVKEDQLAVAKDSLKSNILQSYYGALIAAKSLRFTQESKSRLDKLFSDQQQLYKNGFIERLDLDKTQVSLNNLQSTLYNLSSLVALSYAGLKFSMGIPQKDSLVLTDSLSMQDLKRDILSREAEFVYEKRNEIKALNTATELLKLNEQRYKLGAFPTVALFWNGGTSAQRQNFDFFDTKGRWFYSSVGGINMSMKLFDGNQRRNRMKQANIAVQKNENTIAFVKQSIDLEIEATRLQFLTALEALQSQEDNQQLAQKVYDATKLKYERGLGSSFEVLQSDTNLQQAINNYYQAMYNATITRIKYFKALGKL